MTGARGIILKSAREIELMRRAGSVVAAVHARVREMARPGATTGELDAVAEEIIDAAGGTALFKGVENPQARMPFPAALCTSVNEEVVHGIPGSRSLRDGDLLSVDCGVRLDGYCGDAAATVAIGEVSKASAHLVSVTQGALDLAIREIRPGRMWSEIAASIQRFVEREHLSVVREFVGHGIGRDMHEEPKVPNFWDRGQRQADFRLLANMVIAVEPMVNMGSAAVGYGDKAGWVVVTRDGRRSAHFEHTIAVTQTGADVLTDGRG
ncbi:MAG: type I methionyl aminopeptidase [Phycisphaerae bacterium]